MEYLAEVEDPLTASLPLEIERLRRWDAAAVEGLEDLAAIALGAVEVDTGHRYISRRTGGGPRAIRSEEAARRIEEARCTIDAWHGAVLRALDGGPRAAVRKIYEVIEGAGYEVREHPQWGGICVVPEGTPLDLQFPAWLVREEIAKVRERLEHSFGRALSDREVATTVRDMAIAHLRRREAVALAVTGHTLREQASGERSARRQRQRAEYRRTHQRVGPTLADRIIEALGANPDAGVKALARVLRADHKRVSRELVALERAGRVTRVSRGQRHEYAVAQPGAEGVPPVRVEGRELRVDLRPALDAEEAPPLTARRRSRRG